MPDPESSWYEVRDKRWMIWILKQLPLHRDVLLYMWKRYVGSGELACFRTCHYDGQQRWSRSIFEHVRLTFPRSYPQIEL